MSDIFYRPSPVLRSDLRLKLFISHSWRYGEHRAGIHRLLEQVWRRGEDFVDLAVPADHPIHDADSDADLFDKLRDRIEPCDVLLVLGGMYANASEWIGTEVDIARALRVPVIVIVPFDQERVASTATRLADQRVGWRGESIRNAILAHAPAHKAVEIEKRVKARGDAAMAAMLSVLYGAQNPRRTAVGNTLLTSPSRVGPPPRRVAPGTTVLTSGLPPRPKR
jgi:hypothetical protein